MRQLKSANFFSLVCAPCLFLVLSVFSCKEIDYLLTFRIRNEVTFTIPSAIGINTPTLIPTPDVTTNATENFPSNNTDVNKVKDIKLQSLILAITSPAGATFSPVRSIRIYISAPGVEEKLLAYKENIPTNIGNILNLDVSGEKMDNYVKRDTYSLRTEVITRQAVFQDTSVKARMEFSVTAAL